MASCAYPGCLQPEKWSGRCPEHYWQMCCNGLEVTNRQMGESIERLQRELEMERQESGRLRETAKEATHLRDLLNKYGGHKLRCAVRTGSLEVGVLNICDCGWKELQHGHLTNP